MKYLPFKFKTLALIFLSLFLFCLSFSFLVSAKTKDSFLSQSKGQVLGIFDKLKKLSPFGSKKKVTPPVQPSLQEKAMMSSSKEGGGGGVTTANPVLPSVTGFATDKFTGAATVSYPIALPPGLGGFAPSLSLSYSSGSIADGYNGIKDWEGTYYHQASEVGLGWNLGGLGYIVRDPGSWKDTKIDERGVKDDNFFLVFPGGSAELVNTASYEQRNDQWKTVPDLFLKIRHAHYPGGDGYGVIAHDTEHWVIKTKDGTTYYFGGPAVHPDLYPVDWTKVGALCEDANADNICNNGEYIFPTAVDASSGGDANPFAGHSLATQYERAYKAENKARNRLLPHQWWLRKIVDTHGNTIEIKYEARAKKVKRNTTSSGGQCPESSCPNHYINDLRPVKIIYGKDGRLTIDLVWGERPDYKVKDYENEYVVNFFSRYRLQEIQIKVDGRIARSYVLGYGESGYGAWRCEGSSELHSLLTSITQFGIDGAQALPSYTFTYYNDYPSEGKGCPRDGEKKVYPRNNHFNNVLLKTADNGYGGKVSFEYDYVTPPVCVGSSSSTCKSKGWCCIGDASEYGSYRARVRKKIIEDGMSSVNSYQITYDYSDGGKAHVQTQIDGTRKIPYTGYRFLGYGQVDEKLYALNNPSKIETLSKTFYFDQVNDGWAGGDDDDYSCLRPDPRAGRAKKAEVIDSSGKVLTASESKFLVRPLGTEFSCSQVSSDGAYFVAPIETLQTTGNKTSKVEYTLYDDYGNLKEAVYQGDISKNGDERTTYTEYYPNLSKWMLSFPAWTNIYKGDSRGNPGGENLVTQAINYYDGATDYHTPPEKGDLTMIQQGKGEDKSSVACVPGGFGGLLASRFEYDEFGNQTKVIDPLGNVSETVYDETYKTYPTDVYNALRHHTHTEYNFTKGVPTIITDPNGNVTEVFYDDFGRRKKVLQPALSALGGARPEVRFEYFDRRERNAPVSVFTEVLKDDGTFLPSIVHYNGLGQQLQSQSPWEGSNIVVSNTNYNSLGKVDKASLPYDIAGGVGNLRASDWSKPYSQSFYDALGRVVNVKNPDGTEMRNEYSDWTVVSYDAENHKSLVENDAYGQAVKAQTFDDDGSVYTTTTSEYDILGNITKVEQKDGASGSVLSTAIASYDSHSWKLTSDDSDLGRYRYCYDKNGNLLWQMDPKEQVIQFEYDSLNRAKKKLLPDGCSYVSYSYDSERDGNEIARLSRRDDFGCDGATTGFADYDYDELGRSNRVSKGVIGESFVTSFSYNLLGNLSTVTYPDGEVVANSYDDLGRLKRVAGGDVYVSGITYTPQGEMKTITLGDGTTTTYTYHEQNRRLLGISSPVLGYEYDYDKVGNIKLWRGFSSSESLTFDYDRLYRLKSASGFYNTSYDYDKLGRMFTKNEEEILNISFDTGFPLHAPKNVGSVNYQYDANGNLLNDGTRTISWNAENKPIKVEIVAVITPPAEPTVLPTPEISPSPSLTPPKKPTGLPLTPVPTRPKRSFKDIMGVSTENLKAILRGETEFDLNSDGVVNSLDFGQAVLESQAPTSTPGEETQTLITDYLYDGDGVRVLRQVTVGEGGGEETKEKKLYVNQYFVKDLLSGEIEKYYFAGGKRVAERVIGPECDKSKEICDLEKCRDSLCSGGSCWVRGGETSPFGEYDTGTSTECCGDDVNEKYVCTTHSGKAVCRCCREGTTSVDANGRCISHIPQ